MPAFSERITYFRISAHWKPVIAILSGLSFLLLCLLAVKFQLYLVWLVPPMLLLLIVAFVRIDIFFLLLLFLTPLSVQLRFLVNDPPADIFLPTEIMLFLILVIMIFKIFNSKEYDRSAMGHPVTIITGIMLLWMVITTLTGTMIVVSLKYFLARLWFVGAFYLLAIELFKERGFIKRSLTALVAGLVPVVAYHLVGLLKAGLFNQEAAHITMWPFFNDHTSFGAALAFIIPVLVWLGFGREGRGIALFSKVFFAGLLLLFLAGFIFSYSRAAWISLVVAILFTLALIARIQLKLVISISLLIIIIVIASWTSIITTLGGNRQSASGNIAEHIMSISNITSDVSNMERINRWKSALRMISEKPVTGWGPGTYQFKYAPYQFSHERTIISTNFGDRGNAHSEYLGSAVDSGIPGGILFIMIAAAALATGYRVWRRSDSRYDRGLVLAVQAGLITYLFHAFLNNFLDTDKISAPFWIFIAIMVVMDLQLSKRNDPDKSGQDSSNN